MPSVRWPQSPGAGQFACEGGGVIKDEMAALVNILPPSASSAAHYRQLSIATWGLKIHLCFLISRFIYPFPSRNVGHLICIFTITALDLREGVKSYFPDDQGLIPEQFHLKGLKLVLTRLQMEKDLNLTLKCTKQYQKKKEWKGQKIVVLDKKMFFCGFFLYPLPLYGKIRKIVFDPFPNNTLIYKVFDILQVW